MLRAVPSGDTHDMNARLNLYYMPASRGYRTHDYLGIYFDMSIRYIGKLEKDMEVNLQDGKFVGETAV